MLPSTKFVPVGIVSFTTIVAGAVPSLLSNSIVYVIISPTFTFSPLAGFEVLLNLTSALFTVFVTSSVLHGNQHIIFRYSFSLLSF